MARPVYRFGEFRVDPVARELWRGDQLVALPPHVFDCLAYLIARHDRAVGRDELVAAVWGRTEVSDTLLGQTVLRIRRELGDDGKDPHVLRTIPRFGYRWVAPLRMAEDDADAAIAAPACTLEPAEAVEVDDPPAPAPPPRRTRPLARPALAAVLAALVAVVAVALVQRGRHSAPPAAMPAAPAETAAVMPAAVEPGAEWAWMRLGVMDVVATRLRGSGLPTVPSENVIALLNAPPAHRAGSLREAAAFRLQVSPRVSRRGDAWEVSLDADDGAGQRFSAQARARDATEAAREAADRLLVALGRSSPPRKGEPAPQSELLQRIDAAILADDPDTARGLIEQASVDRHSPELQLRLAKIDFRAGHVDAAQKRLEGLLADAPASTAPVLRASILNGLGAVAIRSDRPQQAEQAFAQAGALLAGQAEPEQLGQAYLGRAGAAAMQRRFEDASADYARARVAFREANDARALIRVDANEGFLDLDRGRPAQALPQLAAAADGFARWGALNEAVFAHIGQISSRLALLEGAAASATADAAAALAERVGNVSTKDSLTIARARALSAVGRLGEARASLQRLREANPDPADVTAAAAAVPLARIELDGGNDARAAELAASAVAVLTDAGYAGLRADAWLTQVRALARTNDRAGAAAQAAAFQAWAAQTGGRAPTLAQLARADVAWRFVESGWRGEFDAARTLADAGGVPADVAQVAIDHAGALIAVGELDAAEVEVGRIARWSGQDFACAVLEARFYAARGRDAARQTALARARELAGERPIPAEATAVAVSAREASAH
ncbi:winged helix-turn-helix domain-containing protein [Dokdonella ginsengisoli]|uniref:Winged helix-turn-helix domain-containing protein n=1 Tax=Dokdonella ginsengisoli TaxID=363846 RepID=A0ABV9QVS9_9GAMM